MGESGCLMQPFSYAAGIPNEAQEEGNPVHALGQSVSFGRFMSESLAWEKWSTFSHNRYVEEAEKYARPGSVAQKKAFFEAHYKKLAAARKAAALLEQANVASNDAPESEDGRHDMAAEGSQTMSLNSEESVCEPEAEAPNVETGLVIDANGLNSMVEKDKLECSRIEGAHAITEQQVLVENSMRIDASNRLGVTQNNDVGDTEPAQKENYVKVESSKKLGNMENSKEVRELELSKRNPMEKHLFKNTNIGEDDAMSMSKTKPAFSTLKSSSYSKASKLLSSPAAPPRHKKENNANTNANASATPVSKKSSMDSKAKRRLTPKSSKKSYNFTPAKEFNRLTSKIVRKIDSSRGDINSKTSKDCSTPLRTPKHSLATPLSENRSAKRGIDSSASGSNTVRPRWHFLPTENKSYSPSLFTPFSLRTEERAARRKEKLEEKFKATEVQKQQQQATLKEKAEMELKKLRQSLCFKARPLPDFYKERATPRNQTKNVPLTRERNHSTSNTSITQNRTSHPPKKSSINNTVSKHAQENNSRSSIHSVTSQPAMTT